MKIKLDSVGLTQTFAKRDSIWTHLFVAFTFQSVTQSTFYFFKIKK